VVGAGHGREEGRSGEAHRMNEGGADPDSPAQGRGPRKRRRLVDMILLAAHSACDQGDLEVGERLLAIAEFMLRRGPPEGRPERRGDAEPLVAALERIWTLRHPEAPDD